MTRMRVVHLVDDTTAGGVMQVVDHITTSADLAQDAQHSVRIVNRRSLAIGRIDADVIVSHLSISWRGLPILLSLRATNTHASLVHVEHSYTEGFVANNVTRHGRFATLLRTSYAIFDRVVAVSRAQGRWLTSRRYVHPESLVVIQSCADMAAFRGLPRPKGPVRVIGAIGRLDRQKGFDTLITAFRQCRDQDIVLQIYGEGCEREELERLADGDPRIRFMGFAPNVAAAMSEIDAVVMPSRWEAYGLVAIEALAAGRVVLVSAVDGLTDHEPRGAHVVHATSVRSWSRAIDRLAAGDLAPSTPRNAAEVDTLETCFATLWLGLLATLNCKVSKKATADH